MVPDNLKSGVTRACFYEPTVQRSYEHMALHYGTAVLPARPGQAASTKRRSRSPC